MASSIPSSDSPKHCWALYIRSIRVSPTLDDGSDFVEAIAADFLLVRNEGVAFFAGSEFLFLNHVDVVPRAFAVCVSLGELDGIVPIRFEALTGR